MPPTLGVDIAAIDGNRSPIGYAKAYQAGCRFTIIRAVYGRPVAGQIAKGPYIDQLARRDAAAVRAANQKFGAYLFLCYQLSAADRQTPSPEEQVMAYVASVGDVLQRSVDMVPWLDVEEDSKYLGAIGMLEWTMRAVKALSDYFGVMPGIYTSQRVWHENMKDIAAPGLVDCPMWLAKPWPHPVRSPVDLSGGPASGPLLPMPHAPWGNQWVVYQYQGDGLGMPGFSSTTDVNRFRVFGKGAKGDHVKWVQRRLNASGEHLLVDGDFGTLTDTALRTYQQARHLAVDGFMGLQSFCPLGWE